jgi:hypothetical protein
MIRRHRAEIVVPRRDPAPAKRAKVTARFHVKGPKGVEYDCVQIRHITLNEVERLEVSEFNRLYRPEREAP